MLAAAEAAIRDADLHRRHGRVIDLIGLIVEATGLEAEVGEVCTINTGRGRAPVPAEVVGFRAGRTLLMALGDAAWLSAPALKRAVDRASHVLTAPGVAPLFGQLLKRLRQLARKHADAELEAWVRGVASALPGD